VSPFPDKNAGFLAGSSAYEQGNARPVDFVANVRSKSKLRRTQCEHMFSGLP
jgi:hypothetical protein